MYQGSVGGRETAFQYIPYIWPLIASALISLSLAIFALFRRKNVKGSTYFILLMFLVTLWSGGNALEMSGTDLSTKLFWANLQYIAYAYSPVMLLALSMEFTGYDRWIRNKKTLLWVAVLPTIIILLVWTDRHYGLIRYDIHLDYSGSFPVIAKKYGPVFFIYIFYVYLLNFIAWLFLTVTVFSKRGVYQKQAIALLLGYSITFIPNITYVLGLGPIKRFDITPTLFGLSGLSIAWGMFRFKLFDVVPVARATVIETMDAGVMVLDLQDRVLDINTAFKKMVNYPASRLYTKTVEEVCAGIPDLVSACIDRSITQREFCLNTHGLSKVYELFVSPITNKRGSVIGRLILTYDITEKQLAQQEYLRHQWKLAVTEERERQARDMHDNLGQVLGFINMQAQGIRQELKNAGVEIASLKLNRLVETTQAAHTEIREYIRNTMSAATIEKDFIAALTKDILNFEEQTGLKIALNMPIGFAWEELEPGTRINILNILKEALNNIRKHAGAANVNISFALDREQLCASVEDDGKGFDVERHDNTRKTKFGLNIMRERASEIGAQINIKSTTGKGSRIELLLPLEKRQGD